MPSSLVVPEYFTPVASFTIMMSALAIARPEGSSTSPLIVPFGDCPIAAVVRRTSNNRGWRGKRNLTRAAPGSHGFILIHPVYGSPFVFVPSGFRTTAGEKPVVGFPAT